MNDPETIAQNIGRACALLCSYHEEVAGVLRDVRSQLAAGDPPLAHVSYLGAANNAVYMYPSGVTQMERARAWMPRDIGEFYAEEGVISGARDRGIVLPYVYFQTGVEDAVEPPWVIVGVLYAIEGGERGREIYKVCNRAHRGSLELTDATWPARTWREPEEFADSGVRLTFDQLWFPFADLLRGSPKEAIAREIVGPLRERFALRRAQS